MSWSWDTCMNVSWVGAKDMVWAHILANCRCKLQWWRWHLTVCKDHLIFFRACHAVTKLNCETLRSQCNCSFGNCLIHWRTHYQPVEEAEKAKTPSLFSKWLGSKQRRSRCSCTSGTCACVSCGGQWRMPPCGGQWITHFRWSGVGRVD